MFLSVALLLRHGLDLQYEAAAVESAVDRALSAGLRTPDLGERRDRRGGAGRARPPLTGAAVNQADVIWMNGLRRLGGRQGPRAHARVALRDRGVRGHPLL